MSTFGNAFADTYAVDGIILKVMTGGWDIRASVMSWMRDFMREGFEGTEKDWDRLYQAKIFNMSTDRSKAVVRFQIYGSLCKRAMELPAGQLAFLSEVHVKSYAFSNEDPYLERLRDAIYNSDGGQQANLFGASQFTNVQKGDGRGWRIGDRKSDYHFVCYVRTGQRPGIELRVKDAPVRRMAAEAIELCAVHGLSDASAWRVIVSKIAKLGGDRLDADFMRKGISPEQFFIGFTDVKPIQSADPVEVRPLRSEGTLLYDTEHNRLLLDTTHNTEE